MTQKKKRIPLFMLVVLTLLVMGMVLVEHESVASPTQALNSIEEKAVADTDEGVPVEAESVPRTEAEEETAPVAQMAPNPWHNYPNVCETFNVVQGTKLVKTKNGKTYPLHYKRNRYNRKKSDTYRTRDLIKMVVGEMGGDKEAQRIVAMIALHESSWNPEAVHVLNPDREANKIAWQKHSYSKNKELAIVARKEKTSAKSKEFWHYKAVLADIRLYKGNPHWNDQLEYTYTIPAREDRGESFPESSWKEHRSVWAFGYGLYGMNAVLFTHLWDRQAPPWILCGDEGIEATVMAVWALRNAQAECENLTGQDAEKYGTDGGNARGVVRRFARGRCGNQKLGKAWQRLMADMDGIDWGTRPDFGNKFGQYERHRRGGKWRWTKDEKGKRVPGDREAILAHIRAKAEKKGLLREVPLKRKKGSSAPVIVARNQSVAVGAM